MNYILHGDIQYCKSKNIILPTPDKTKILKQPNGTLEYDTNPIYGINHLNYKFQHLYIVSDEKVNENDWCIIDGNEVINWNYQKYRHYPDLTVKRIIATTDPKLIENGLPKISQSFIKKYCDKNGINESLVEMKKYNFRPCLIGGYAEPGSYEYDLKPKTNTENEITILNI